MINRVTFAVSLISVLAGLVRSSEADDSMSRVFDAVTALQRQQTQIVDNQTKLDEKIANLGETIRVARIYMSRAGGKHKPPPPPKPPPKP